MCLLWEQQGGERVIGLQNPKSSEANREQDCKLSAAWLSITTGKWGQRNRKKYRPEDRRRRLVEDEKSNSVLSKKTKKKQKKVFHPLTCSAIYNPGVALEIRPVEMLNFSIIMGPDGSKWPEMKTWLLKMIHGPFCEQFHVVSMVWIKINEMFRSLVYLEWPGHDFWGETLFGDISM